MPYDPAESRDPLPGLRGMAIALRRRLRWPLGYSTTAATIDAALNSRAAMA